MIVMYCYRKVEKDYVKMAEVISCFGCQISSSRKEKNLGCLTSCSEYCSCLDVCLHAGLTVLDAVDVA